MNDAPEWMKSIRQEPFLRKVGLTNLKDSSYASAQLAHYEGKDEDKFIVEAGPPGLCDLIIAVFDGHGGRSTAEYCTANFTRFLEEEFNKLTFDEESKFPKTPKTPAVASNVKVTSRYETDTDPLSLLSPTSQNISKAWHPKADEAITNTYIRLDDDVKAGKASGGAAAVTVFLREKGSTLYAKTAWAGDSRAIAITQDGGFELSIDHKPNEEKEYARVNKHFDAKKAAELKQGAEPAILPVPGTGAKVANFLSHIKEAMTPRKTQAKSPFALEAAGITDNITPKPASKSRFAAETVGDSNSFSESRPQHDGTAKAVAESASAGSGTGAGHIPPFAVSEAVEHHEEEAAGLHGMVSEAGAVAEAFANLDAGIPGAADEEPVVSTSLKGLNVKTSEGIEAAKPAETALEGKEKVDPEAAHKVANGGKTGLSRRYSYVSIGDDVYTVSRVVGQSGLALAMSRSIGDAGSSTAVIAKPEFQNAFFRKGQAVRFVVGSDGVWDVLSSRRVANEAYIHFKETAPEAAMHIARLSKQTRLRYWDMFGDDDITAVVVDVNFEGVEQKLKKYMPGANSQAQGGGGGGGGGCCIVM